jgi:hypothetical protein
MHWAGQVAEKSLIYMSSEGGVGNQFLRVRQNYPEKIFAVSSELAFTNAGDFGKFVQCLRATLAPNQAVAVHTGAGTDTDTDTDVFWGRARAVWNNRGENRNLSHVLRI